jgi:hypothetical protein
MAARQARAGAGVGLARGESVRSCIFDAPDTKDLVAMAIRAKLTPAEELAASRAATSAAADKPKRVISDEEKATRRDRVAKAKDALARSVGTKGEHVAGARAALKTYLQRLNEPKQPDDAQFEALLEAPFKAPPKKKTNERRF